VRKGRKEKERDTIRRVKALVSSDPYLAPYESQILGRLRAVEETLATLLPAHLSLPDFASAHEYFGLHREGEWWVFREWAPHATALFLMGDFSGWQPITRYALKRISEDGIWEIRMPGNTLSHLDLYRLWVQWPEGQGDRIPAYARRIHQDANTLIFNAQVWYPPVSYHWQHPRPAGALFPLIYEAHVGMAQEKETVGSYEEFTDQVLPRIANAGYNTLQLMAIQQHPYYGSFGYHVANFFAASARFGTPEALKALIDTAHGMGIRVLMDLVHSHAVSNEVEGLSRFDGSEYQYFHEGPRGYHPAWDSRCFDYGKPQVLHFLLSNCRYWLDEFRVDGFRFDGVTSMLYRHHGLGKAFVSYEDYFDDALDLSAFVYLSLANRLIHRLRPDAITIAEDVSGMPGLAAPESKGGVGFDYRFAMGIADHWIRMVKDQRDEQWHMGNLRYELNNRRIEEKTISYAEAHDQALVGDQSLMFRMAGAAMYEHMRIEDPNPAIERAVALHKMIRLITLATAGHGYLNFMGNEFGHPEWIDFPRSGNGWSYRYARRQWHLVDDPGLRYGQLFRFDQEMIRLARNRIFLGAGPPRLRHEHNEDKILAFERGELLFAFNFHPDRSRPDYRIAASDGRYRMILDSDATIFGGQGRLSAGQIHCAMTQALSDGKASFLSLYLPSRTAIVLERTSR
jgi:1,4-alpha-glucan branching enzyme